MAFHADLSRAEWRCCFSRLFLHDRARAPKLKCTPPRRIALRHPHVNRHKDPGFFDRLSARVPIPVTSISFFRTTDRK